MKPIGEILPVSRVILDMEISSKKRLFEEIGRVMADEEKGLSAADVFDCLFARERLGTTGLGQGVAIPHGRHASVSAPMGAFVRLTEAIDFESPDNKPVQLVFVLLVPETATCEHLDILSYLAERFSDKQIRTALLEAQNTEIARELLIQ